MRGSITSHRKQTDAWRLRVYLGKDPATGKERYRSKVFHGGKKDADDLLNEMISEVKTKENLSSKMTLEQLLTEWLRFCRNKGLAVKTISDYEWRSRRHIIPELGSTPINDLSAKHLDDYYGALRAKDYSSSTIRHTHAIMRQALGQAVKWGWLNRNVALLATVSAPMPILGIAPRLEQLKAIIAEMSSSNPQFAAMIALAALTGARRGELLALHWSDVDIENSVLWIRGSLVYTKDSGVVLGPTKTKRARKVPLDQVARVVIQRQMQELEAACAKLEIAHVDNPWLFFGEIDGSKSLFPDSVSSAFRRVTKRLGIEDLHFHSLRHFTATQLIAAGVDIRTVSGRLGHSDPSVTLRVYSHVLEDNDRAASDIMGRLLSP